MILGISVVCVAGARIKGVTVNEYLVRWTPLKVEDHIG